jgi:hypothetical protein
MDSRVHSGNEVVNVEAPYVYATAGGTAATLGAVGPTVGCDSYCYLWSFLPLVCFGVAFRCFSTFVTLQIQQFWLFGSYSMCMPRTTGGSISFWFYLDAWSCFEMEEKSS